MKIDYLMPDYQPDLELLRKRCGLTAGHDDIEEFTEICQDAAARVKPKALLINANSQIIDKNTVEINGIRFSSALLVNKLQTAQTVWPYLATCGEEVYLWAQKISDPLERFWVEEVMQQALVVAMSALNEKLNQYYSGKTSAMNPGSLADWPMREQKPLFQLFGEAHKKIGVTLTPSMLMLPNKSVSGIRFADESGYVNCMLCQKENCQNRKALYDQTLALNMAGH